MNTTEVSFSEPITLAVVAFAAIGLITVIRWMCIKVYHLWMWIQARRAPTERHLDIIDHLLVDSEYDPSYEGPFVASTVAKANAIIDHLLKCQKSENKKGDEAPFNNAKLTRYQLLASLQRNDIKLELFC